MPVFFKIIVSIKTIIKNIARYIAYLYISSLNIYKYIIYIALTTNPKNKTGFEIVWFWFSIPAIKNNVEI